MDSKELYVKLATNKIAISEALAISLAYVRLSLEEKEWVESELNGYDGKLDVPDYRQLPCEVKARVQNNYSGIVQDTRLVGQPMEELDTMLMNRFGLSIYKIYVSQSVESIEKQILNHDEGDIIMIIDGPPGRELRDSIKTICNQYYSTAQYVFQTAPVAYMQNALSVIKNKLMTILQGHFADMETNQVVPADEDNNKKVVFISYCWESEDHKDWVRKLASDLNELFEVKIDQELPFGVELTHFMEQAIAESDKVLIIATPEYKDRADNRKRGVGYETSLITDDLVNYQNRIKFIPIIRKGTKELSYPRYLGSKKGADMTDDSKYEIVLEELKRNLLRY